MTPGAVMIFAAGRGTRMGALTATRPKPLIEVAGRPLIDHALALTGGLRRVVNIHHHADQMRAHLAGLPDLAISDETGSLLETGGGLRKALPLLGRGPVFTLNSDAVWRGPNPLDVLARAWDPARMDGLVLLVRPQNTRGHSLVSGFVTDAEGRIGRGLDYAYPGAQILRTDGLAAIEEDAFSLNLLWDRMIAAGRLFGTVYPGLWCDVGRPENIALAEDMLHEPV